MERKAVGSRDTEDSMRMIEDDDPGDGLRDNLEELIDFSLGMGKWKWENGNGK